MVSAVLAVLATSSGAALAQAGATPATPAAPASAPQVVGTLPRVVTSATRIETAEDQVAATITTRTAEEIERRGARDLKSLLDDEPGIAVRLQPARMSAVFGATGRGGNEGINIRGLEGNQVLLQTDGVRLPLAYDSGPFVAGRGDYIDIEAYKRVELLRGPSSTAFGSDGLSGAVSFVTKDPSDLLRKGESLAGAVKLGYDSADKSWSLVPQLALRDGAWEGLLLASIRRGHELDNQGSNTGLNWNRTAPNPQDRSSDYVLGKALYRLDGHHQFKATLEWLDRSNRTDPLYTLIGMPLVNANVTGGAAQEDISRTLGKLEWQYVNPRAAWFQRVNAHVYAQDTSNRQWGQETYGAAAAWSRRVRDTRYGERSTGASVQAEANFGVEVAHRVLVGADVSDARLHSYKDGAHYAQSGSLIVGGFVPNQSFPDTDYRTLGAFVQDEISWGALTVTPALRLDRFSLQPDTGNPLYTVNNKVAPSTLSDSAASPRLGLVWKLSPQWQVYSQYGHGFRAPTPWQVNGGVSNTTANPPYRSIGNPDLKPEHSRSLELGLRGRLGDWSGSLALYSSRYRDFIDSNVDVTATTTVPLEAGMAASTRTFQSVNLRRAEIAGVEAQLAWRFLPGWKAEARYAHAKGDSVATDGTKTPLASIEPDKATLSLAYEQAERYGAELLLTAQRSQRRPQASGLIVPEGYAKADLSAWWNLSRDLQLMASLNNLSDRNYVLWTDIRGLTSTAANLALVDAYSQPGRSVSASLRWRF
ncbi:MAG: TonB-dependent hemoglobin/transferrin/lactoferrin family receptor [Burkholderiaceae bacterium]|nr:TonB-dependent hemoglobin/transferrin/lactoferrin family receptor [Burkholderiaceae bacterium]